MCPPHGPIINLEHVLSVDRMSNDDLRIMTILPGVTITLKKGSPDEASFTNAIGQRLAQPAQIIAALRDICEVLNGIKAKP